MAAGSVIPPVLVLLYGWNPELVDVRSADPLADVVIGGVGEDKLFRDVASVCEGLKANSKSFTHLISCHGKSKKSIYLRSKPRRTLTSDAGSLAELGGVGGATADASWLSVIGQLLAAVPPPTAADLEASVRRAAANEEGEEDLVLDELLMLVAATAAAAAGGVGGKLPQLPLLLLLLPRGGVSRVEGAAINGGVPVGLAAAVA